MRHATREVLGREYSDEELMQAVGGPGLEAQMHAFAPDRVEQLVDVYRAHNEPLHDELEACAGMEDVLARLHDGGPAARRGDGEAALDRRARVRATSRSATSSRPSSAATRRERHKPDPEPLLLGAERLGADPAATAYVGDSPFDVRAAKAAGMFAVAVTWGRIHDRARLEAEAARRDRRHAPRSSLASSKTTTAAARAAELRDAPQPRAHRLPRRGRADHGGRGLRRALRRARRARGGASRARHARLADAARGGPCRTSS